MNHELWKVGGKKSLILNSFFSPQLLLKLFVSAIFILSFVQPASSYASSNFTTDYNIVYTIQESGVTNASISAVLTNTTSEFYAREYEMKLGFDNISNVKASDPHGGINAKVNKTNGDGNNVLLAFNKKAIGVSNQLPFSLTFETDSIARKSGGVWEINIPGISNPADFGSFSIEVRTPLSFGKPAYVKPSPKSGDLKFSKSEIGKSGISIAYGERKSYRFELAYHLGNTNLFPAKREIALPPDTNYQRVFIESIDPKPTNVVVDQDGNWLAQYSLPPAQKEDVIVKGEVEVRLSPETEEITTEQKDFYTKSTRYWQSSDQSIQKLAHNLKTPREIYKHVVKTLKYDYNQATDGNGRLGALGALKNPDSSVCREFTDLFIAISRAAGIPAREVDGFAYTQDNKERPVSLAQDILHAWPEYYDTKRKAWIMVDPTWGATSGIDYFNVLDFDHVVFAVKGVEDDYPAAAGGYKFGNSRNSKDVVVKPSAVAFEKIQRIDINTNLSKTHLAGFPLSAKVKLSNLGPAATKKQELRISSKTLTPKNQASEMSVIPPFGHAIVDAKFDRTGILTNEESLFTMHFGEKTTVKNLKIYPFYLLPWN